jgi:hypothetical protein
MFGGLGRAVKAFATPDNLMQIGALLKDTSSGGMDNFMNVQRLMQSRQDRQRALDLEERQKTAIANLLGQFKPDTQTPQMNDLIGQLNQRQAQFGDAPAPMERVKPAFDLSNPATMGAVGQYLQSGGGFGDISALRQMTRPEAPKYMSIDPTENLMMIDPENNQMSMVRQGAAKPPPLLPGTQWVDGEMKFLPGAENVLRESNRLKSLGTSAGRPPPRPRVSSGGGSNAAIQPMTKQIGARTYYYVRGEWYDNPEGR